ncbi:nucleoside triphosphate pyrophosphohydrolase [Streptomyces sp. ISL-44]|uniref:nucleoside triphosphate pyrophosphohydrolase n=1 Tax=unclassified Streptomyces TaxID=2593676 RepID=UPI001BE88B16|nr:MULTISPECIES: nucleoside triphosphate pyrophosphohydrolase [unclassified Streptomyces]MBT2539174.1 nucleoside triphosphate pyrophosphohydrolase [Streptomyces sp. ISL-44]MCX5013560.1 nucleoside triphosphate pyrophosphohydrolase [Streptomyces sp. NBC_00555]MCX5607581.1 nucleoside triphosphate pyrophosphohydrolase [Streptomyces sp. NBC_00047]UUU41681.1 nucleoside triphosphate pyrophosphohydrolase [Streptomyces sp. NBC_00162]
MTDHDPSESTTAEPTGRIVLLTTSHRVAPGVLSWPAWQTLHAADRVLCADPGHPQLPYLREAGVEVVHESPDAQALVEACAGGGTAVVLLSGEGDQRLTDGLARLAGSGRVAMPDLELLPGSYDLPGARLLDLVQVMDRVRRECPWTSRQTHRGLAKYAIEEAYELVEAIEDGNREELREELGDVLLQVVFHARIAEDFEEPDEAFSIDDVAGTLVEKLIHRHPHVFGEEKAETPEDVSAHWQRTKAAEKRRESVTEGIPLGQPGLALAAKLAGRVRSGGLAVELPRGEGIGYELLELAARAEAAGIDPETALRAAARVYRDAIRAAEGVGE